MQLQTMSSVPRPGGPLVHPSLGGEYSTWLMSAEMGFKSIAISVSNEWTRQIETCTIANRNIITERSDA